ncbi:hypothetical protein D8911_03945 [Levilactobacillus brevis]|nr:hypothetical protein D8911_03945 [Levilactobacillus brevis]
MKKSVKGRFPLTLISAFFVPIIIMGSIFISMKMIPFGSNSLLTVDLNQQYIDFFAYLRNTILHDPSSLFYSFSNGFGGEMFGTWSYYLLSPLNWILLFCTGTSLTTGIFFITLAKYGLAGLSFAYLLLKTSQQKGLPLVTFSTVYALMGWTIANQLNIIWLDSIYLLPLVFLGLYFLVNNGEWKMYLIWLTISLIVNYYMAYMICLFMILMFIFLAVNGFENKDNFIKQTKLFILSSLGSAMLSAFVLLPTFWSLLQSKAHYTASSVRWNFEFFPPKMIAKFFMGSLNTSQLPEGTANLFVGSIVLVGFLFYFFDKHILRRTRITAAIVSVFLLLSMCFRPLDVLWHAGQFPVWYTYRFSFVVCFWLVWLAAQELTAKFKANKTSLSVVMILLMMGVVYVALNLSEFSFLKKYQILLGTIFLLIALILAILPIKKKLIYLLVFFSVGVAEVTMNAYISLNSLVYTPQSQYSYYTKTLQGLVNKVQKQDSGFYRIGKTFVRTRGDAFQTGFKGGDVFSSVIPKEMTDFYGHLGSPDGAGFVVYTNGTLLTDSLLNMKYYLQEKVTNAGVVSIYNPLRAASNKADVSEYKQVGQTSKARIYKNPYALPVGFAASDQVIGLKDKTRDPAKFQANWLSALTGNPLDKNLYVPQNFNRITFDNVKPLYKVTDATFYKKDAQKPGSITLYFTPTTNDAYYLTVGSLINEKTGSFTLNGKPVAQVGPYRHNIMISIANNSKGKVQKLTIRLAKPKLWLQNFTLYKFDNNAFENSVGRLQQHPWKLEDYSNRYLRGNVTSENSNQVLNTSIPYSEGWHAKVNGKTAEIYKTVNMFMAVKLSKGKNEVSFSYWPPLLNIGIVISLLTLVSIVGYFGYLHKKLLGQRKIDSE